MSRRSRAVLLLGLSLVLGGISASSVSRRESALKEKLGPSLPVVVARDTLSAGSTITASKLAVRHLPARYLPAGIFASVNEAVGLKTAVPIAAGGYLGAGMVVDPESEATTASDSLGLRTGQRVVEIVGSGFVDAIGPGSQIDLVVTEEQNGSGRGEARLVLEDTPVVAVRPVGDMAASSSNGDGLEQVAVTLRVSVRQAVYLAAAQSFAHQITFLPRGSRDSKHGYLGLRVPSSLN